MGDFCGIWIVSQFFKRPWGWIWGVDEASEEGKWELRGCLDSFLLVPPEFFLNCQISARYAGGHLSIVTVAQTRWLRHTHVLVSFLPLLWSLDIWFLPYGVMLSREKGRSASETGRAVLNLGSVLCSLRDPQQVTWLLPPPPTSPHQPEFSHLQHGLGRGGGWEEVHSVCSRHLVRIQSRWKPCSFLLVFS